MKCASTESEAGAWWAVYIGGPHRVTKVSITNTIGTTGKFSTIHCCDMGQNDTIGKIELNPSIVLSSDNTNCKNDIQLFHQLFDELSVYRDYH